LNGIGEWRDADIPVLLRDPVGEPGIRARRVRRHADAVHPRWQIATGTDAEQVDRDMIAECRLDARQRRLDDGEVRFVRGGAHEQNAHRPLTRWRRRREGGPQPLIEDVRDDARILAQTDKRGGERGRGHPHRVGAAKARHHARGRRLRVRMVAR
jgi:hypothetical protein